MSISLSKEATISILVHSSKYSGSYICGVLFKKESDSRSESATEIIPLFHSLPLLPLSETAADLVSFFFFCFIFFFIFYTFIYLHMLVR